MIKIYSYCKPYLQRYKKGLIIYITLATVLSASALIPPYIIGDFLDNLMIADDISFALTHLLLFVCISVASVIIGYFSRMLLIKLQMNLGYSLNRDIIEIVQNASYALISNQDAAYLNQRINNDAKSLVTFCISIIQNILANSIIVVITVILLLSFHTQLTIILIAVAIVYFVIYYFYRKILYETNHTFMEAQSVFFGKLHEQILYVKFIKLQSLYNLFIERLNQSFLPLLSSALKRQRASYIFGSLDQLVYLIVQIVLFIIGGTAIIAGSLTVGRFIIVSSFFNLLLNSLRYFFSIGEAIQNNLVSYQRLRDIEDIKHEEDGCHILSDIQYIRLSNLSFSYDKQKIIDDISTTFERGNIYIIRGANGAGKSTFIEVILGLHSYSFSGEILYNGIEMNKINIRDARNRLIGITEQEPILLSDSLVNNIFLDEDRVSLEKEKMYKKLIKIFDLEGLIENPTNGTLNENHEQSNKLSGGEKQKISILRTLLKDPDVIILDEPTSALDDNSKSALFQYINTIKKDKIIIIVTHDAEFCFDDNIIEVLL